MYPRLGEAFCRQRKPRKLYQALMCGRLLLRQPDLSRVIHQDSWLNDLNYK